VESETNKANGVGHPRATDYSFELAAVAGSWEVHCSIHTFCIGIIGAIFRYPTQSCGLEQVGPHYIPILPHRAWEDDCNRVPFPSRANTSQVVLLSDQ
jgi:hypothetical protein